MATVVIGEPAAGVAAYTPQTSVGALLIDMLGPWMTLSLAWYCDAIGAALSPLHDLVTDQGFDGDPDYVPGYGSIFNVETCPDDQLGYLAQFVGVQIPQGMGADQARQLIQQQPAHMRGSSSSIIAAAKMYLTGTQSVTLIERSGPDGPDAWWFTLVVRPEELSSGATWQQLTQSWASTTGQWNTGDAGAALVAAVNAAKPAGLSWQLVVTDAYIWSSATHTWAQDTQTWQATITTQP